MGFVNSPVDFYPLLQEYKKHKTENVRVFPARKTFHVMNAAQDNLCAADQPHLQFFVGYFVPSTKTHIYSVVMLHIKCYFLIN